jgi:type IV pilus assembly protein PilQ
MKIFALVILYFSYASFNFAQDLKELNQIKFYKLEKEYRPTITKVFPLFKAKAIEILPIVENSLSIFGSVYANEINNTLYVTDTKEKIDDIAKLIEELDVEGIKAGYNFLTEIIPVLHTKASSIVMFLSHKLSDKGTISVNEELNSLIITDIESKINEIKKLIKKIDVPIKHILLEIKVVEVDSDYLKKQGFTWHLGIGSYFSWEKHNKEVTTREYFVDIWPVIVNLIKEGKARVLSTQRLVTKNNKRAYLSCEEEIPYSYRYYWEKEKTGVYLEVTPLIHADNTISLSINPTVKSLTDIVEGVPFISENSLITEVKVKNGQTYVLSGLNRNILLESIERIPILSKIPLIKYLFTKVQKTYLKRELLIFITPKILEELQPATGQDMQILKK